MWPFREEHLQDFAVVMLLLTIVFYLMFAVIKSIGMGALNRADKYLRYKEDGGVSEDNGIDGNRLKDTLMASSFSLASAIYVYIEWATIDKLLALWSPITWAFGVLVLVFASKKIFFASKEAWTIHAYLGKKYSSGLLTKITSLVASVVFMLQVAAEVVVGIAVLQVFIGVDISVETMSFLVGAIFIAYSLIGGLPSVLQTDFIQYRVVLFALIAMLLIGINQGGATAFNNIALSLPTFFPEGVGWVLVLSLLALNLPLLITDMSVWQRVGASSSPEEANSGTIRFSLNLFMWMSFIVLLGTGFATSFSELPDTRPVVGMISYFSDTIAYPLLITGLIGALVSTADTFLISSVQTIIADWKYKKLFAEVDYDSSRLGYEKHKKIIRDSRLGILLLGIISVLVGILAWNYLTLLLEFLFVIFGMQTALAPTVINALYGKPNKLQSASSILSVVVGVVAAFIGLVLAMFQVQLFGLSIALWTPIISLSLSTIVFLFGIKMAKMKTTD